MDPVAVLKVLWTHKFWVLPVVILTLFTGTYVYQFGPRSYESTMSVAIVNPDLPSDSGTAQDATHAKDNKDNPFLRSSDPSLITDVLVTKLSSSETVEKIKTAGLGPDYTVGRGVNSNGFVIDITGMNSNPERAIETTDLLGELLKKELHSTQKVNGADDAYLFTSLVVAQDEKPTEQVSSRLRSLIMVLLGGGLLLLGAVSTARSLSRNTSDFPSPALQSVQNTNDIDFLPRHNDDPHAVNRSSETELRRRKGTPRNMLKR